MAALTNDSFGKTSARAGRRFGGRRSGLTLMVLGGLLAVAAFSLVLTTARRSQASAPAQIPQIFVVVATQDIAQSTTIRPESLAIKAFPAAFAPAGVATKIEDVAGKYAATTIARDQLVLASQVSATRRTANLSAAVPAGKVAFWMPLPDLLAASGGVKAGDHVDILLSVTLSPATLNAASTNSGGVTTQTTLQNVEVFFIGSASSADTLEAAPSAPAASGVARQSAKVVAFVLDPQDAVVVKWIKDSGGTIDLVLRSDDAANTIPTESVNADTIVDQFRFRVPEQWGVGRR